MRLGAVRASLPATFAFLRNGQKANRLFSFSSSSRGSGVDTKFPGGGGVLRKKSIRSSTTFPSVVLLALRRSVSERSMSSITLDEPY
jgi:hypothetical protein